MFEIPQIPLTKQNPLVFIAHLPLIKLYKKTLWQVLSYQEKNQSNKFLVNFSKDRYVLSHGILRYLLSFYTKKDPKNIRYFINQFGKPFLENNKEIQFNMSHSKNYVAYVVALENQVGIDIEWKNKSLSVEDVAKLVLSPTEFIYFNKLNLEDKYNIFYDVWTKKEAIIKAIGQGLSYPIKKIEAMDISNDNKVYYVVGSNILYCSKLYNVSNYSGAVAFSSQFDKLRVEVHKRTKTPIELKFL